MQNQKKVLDQELNSNNLTRIPSVITKPKMSLFRALSLSIYFDEDHVEDIVRVLKLCLICACTSKSINSNPFAAPHRKVKFLAKFVDSQEAMDMYIENPDRQCFTYDNLQLVSLAFQKRVTLFKISKEMYLQENLITACSTKVKQSPIMIAKIANRFFCVQSQSTRSVMMFIKQNVINQMMNIEDQSYKKMNQLNLYHYQEQYSPVLRQRTHKKSFSDGGDLMPNIEPEKTESSYIQEGLHIMQNYEGGSTMDQMLYQHYPMMPEPRLQRTNSINIPSNQRYTGRLKFFDQNGNYGFIVVDGFGSDLFVHYDDLQKTGISKERFLNIRNSQEMRFQFTCLEYDGKHKKSKKAVDLLILP